MSKNFIYLGAIPKYFDCLAGKFRNGSGNDCSGLMAGTYGGECFCETCSCGGRVTVGQYMHCFCEKCQVSVKEVFVYRCDSCMYYELSDYFTVGEPEIPGNGYSWGGVGYPLAELGEAFVQGAVVKARRKSL